MKKLLLTSTLLCFSLASAATWTEIAKGISYSTNSEFTSFKVDPKQYSFSSILSKKALGTPTAFVSRIAKKQHALIATNGGYFSKKDSPLGLRITNYKRTSPLKRISWWGVFYIENQVPHLVPSSQFSENKNISFAIQAGPRLLVNGKITKLKEGLAARTALCITKNKKVILAVTERAAMSLEQWADSLKNIGCIDALNLDGGTSSQLYAHFKDFKLEIPNYKPVTDAVIVREHLIH